MPASENHRDVGGAAADVDDHVAGRIGESAVRRRWPPPWPARSGRPSGGAGAQRGVLHGALFDLRDLGRDGDDDARFTRKRRPCAFSMKYLIIFSVTSKSAMTPSFIGRMATMFAGRAAEHLFRFPADRFPRDC